MKRCSRCKQELPEEEFYKRAASKDGLHSYCKSCKLKDVVAHQNRFGGGSSYRRMTLYGLSAEEVRALECVPCCQACGEFFDTPHSQKFDHCHELGHVRGVLCHPCNLAISGTARDALRRMDACRDYLMRDLERQRECQRAS